MSLLVIYSGGYHSFTAPIFKAMVPFITNKERITVYNTRLYTVSEIARIIVPISVTFLHGLGIINIYTLLIINGLSFILSFFAINNIDIASNLQIKKKNIINSYKEIIDFISRNSLFSYLIYASFFSNIILAGFNLVLPVYSVELLDSSSYYGIFLSSESVGSLLGILSASVIKLDKNLVSERIGLLISGFFLLIPTVIISPYSVIFACFILNFFLGRYNISFQNYMQTNLPDSLIGKAFAVTYTLSAIAIPIGSLIFGFLTKYYVSQIFIILAIGLIVINGLWIVLIKLRKGD